MNISIICPLYNAEEYIDDLYSGILKQEKVNIVEIKFILTQSIDNTESKLIELNVAYDKINKKDFSHSLIREKAALSAKGDIVVFITQDIKILNNLWLFYLTSGIEEGVCEASFSRQIGYENHSIERYIREKNYPCKSRIVSKKDIEKLGIMSFFFSDTSSATRKDVFLKLKGYDGKRLATNEDMYFAYKLIMNDYRIKYEAKSEVIHSHECSLKDVYKRYKDIGKFFGQNEYLNQYKASKKGVGVLGHIIKRCLQEKNFFMIIYTFMNFLIRFVGMQVGKIKYMED